MKKLLIALLVLGATQLAIAGGTAVTKIKNMYVYENYTVLKVANKHTNTDSCTHSSADSYLLFPTNTAGGNRLYSAILSAYVANKKIRFGYSGCANWGSKSIPKAYGLSMF